MTPNASDCPCYKCEYRTQNCHTIGNCANTEKTYDEWKTEREKISELERKNRPILTTKAEKALRKYKKY